MKGRTPTASEKEFMDLACSLGCMPCLMCCVETPIVSYHHIDGRVKPGAHYHGFGCCGNHHQTRDIQKPPRWFSVHGNRRKFEETYGTEHELYLMMLEMLDKLEVLDLIPQSNSKL